MVTLSATKGMADKLAILSRAFKPETYEERFVEDVIPISFIFLVVGDYNQLEIRLWKLLIYVTRYFW